MYIFMQGQSKVTLRLAQLQQKVFSVRRNMKQQLQAAIIKSQEKTRKKYNKCLQTKLLLKRLVLMLKQRQFFRSRWHFLVKQQRRTVLKVFLRGKTISFQFPTGFTVSFEGDDKLCRKINIHIIRNVSWLKRLICLVVFSQGQVWPGFIWTCLGLTVIQALLLSRSVVKGFPKVALRSGELCQINASLQKF